MLLIDVHFSSFIATSKKENKVNGSFSACKGSSKGVPQGSVLVALIFNVFINDIFLLVYDTEICNCADDTTIFASDSNANNVQHKQEEDASRLSRCFLDNQMKLNNAKCNSMLF